MSLKPQDRLGPYEILAPIGAGGMGERIGRQAIEDLTLPSDDKRALIAFLKTL